MQSWLYAPPFCCAKQHQPCYRFSWWLSKVCVFAIWLYRVEEVRTESCWTNTIPLLWRLTKKEIRASKNVLTLVLSLYIQTCTMNLWKISVYYNVNTKPGVLFREVDFWRYVVCVAGGIYITECPCPADVDWQHVARSSWVSYPTLEMTRTRTVMPISRYGNLFLDLTLQWKVLWLHCQL